MASAASSMSTSMPKLSRRPLLSCRYDFFGHAEQVIGQHSAPIRTVEFLRETGLIATGLSGCCRRLSAQAVPPQQHALTRRHLTSACTDWAAPRQAGSCAPECSSDA